MAKVTNTKHPDSSIWLLITLKSRHKRDWLQNKLNFEGDGHQTAFMSSSSFFNSNWKSLTSDLLEGSEFKTNNKHTVIVVTNSELTRKVTMNVESKGLSDVCKFLLVLVDLHNILFIVRTQLRNANLSKYQPWMSIHVTVRTASPIQLNYTNSMWNQILGSKHLFQFFFFLEHCAMCTAQIVMHSSNCDVQLKLWCTAQTVSLLAQPSIIFMTHSESQRTDVTFTKGA